ncbi:UBP9-binding protein bun107 [Ceratocystis platani]|uniref:UBP9-binding protein bun107 n=1 Tax=Ceratocystis fimbriata f. sp. platani TaxID=88771 RepID=A0A0F8BJ36_CERFI|nr:UBP9-binding protein bun107 [Ceratocystis platani]
MASKKARQRISYVLDLPQSSNGEGGHRLGVSGLAVDRESSILYSGGRDGMVCAWDLNLNLATKPSISDTAPNHTDSSAHTHWINDIALVQNSRTVVSASSDLTVKVWRPHSEIDQYMTHKIGEHADFVKVVAAPPQSPWVASGALDRKIRLWDLNGGGMTLEIDVSGEEKPEKGSVYALAVSRRLMACGGPESVVRLMDPRTGQKVSKFVGHTDMIRDILLSESGDTVLTASSDNTIKLWSVTAGRCMYTYSMHSESVWALASEAPDLSLFYSADRSGLIVKTDVRGVAEDLDRGLSLALAKENNGVLRIAPAGDFFWTSTASSSINRWHTVNTDSVRLGSAESSNLAEGVGAHQRALSSTTVATTPTVVLPSHIPASSVLRISNTVGFPAFVRRDEENTAPNDNLAIEDPETSAVEPIHHLAEETIEGQNGLVKHVLLNDRRRVLTLDTAGEVLLWDLIQGIPITNYAKRDLLSILPEVNTIEAVAPWCSVDISSGSLTVILEPYNCFDAEMYADELTMKVDPDIEFREDQRINLGKWVLRYLFSGLVDEEVRRDEIYRQKLNDAIDLRLGKSKNPLTAKEKEEDKDDSAKEKDSKDKDGKGMGFKKLYMGMSFGKQKNRTVSAPTAEKTPAAIDEKAEESETASILEKEVDDSFYGAIQKIHMEYDKQLLELPDQPVETRLMPSLPSETPTLVFPPKTKVIIQEETSSGGSANIYMGTVSSVGNDADVIEKRGPMWLGDVLLQGLMPYKEPVKVSFVLHPWQDSLPRIAPADGNNRLNANRMLRVRKILGYVADKIDPIPQPKIKPTRIRQEGMEQAPGSGGSQNQQGEDALDEEEEEENEGEARPNPEEYLELYCNDQLLPVSMSLATLRAHVWKSGSDVMLYYKSNGRRTIPPPPPPPMIPPEEPATAQISAAV